MIPYTLTDPIPGDFEHRGGDCPTHGVNIPFFRVYRTTGPYYCVKCALLAMREKYEPELVSGED